MLSVRFIHRLTGLHTAEFSSTGAPEAPEQFLTLVGPQLTFFLSANDPEVSEFPSPLLPVDLEFAHVCAGRSSPAKFDDFFYVVFFAFEEGFYAAVG